MAELTFSENEIVVSKTDTGGRITYGNGIFLKMSGYKEKEILNKPHNIIRHPDMPRVVFKLLWDYIQNGKEIHAYVVNKSKNGDYYWVFANVTPSYDDNQKIIGYHSTRRKPSQRALNIIKPLYTQLLNAERHGGMEASMKILNEILEKKGVSYEEFILSI